jgi:hypothetical protein
MKLHHSGDVGPGNLCRTEFPSVLAIDVVIHVYNNIPLSNTVFTDSGALQGMYILCRAILFIFMQQLVGVTSRIHHLRSSHHYNTAHVNLWVRSKKRKYLYRSLLYDLRHPNGKLGYYTVQPRIYRTIDRVDVLSDYMCSALSFSFCHLQLSLNCV